VPGGGTGDPGGRVDYLYRSGFAGGVLLLFQFGDGAAAGALYVRDIQQYRAGVCELELASIRRYQADPAQIAESLFKNNLRQRIFRHHGKFR